MRKLFWQISFTLDGQMEGPDGGLGDTAQFVDADFEAYAASMLQAIDDVVLGRVTYELFNDYWPTAQGTDADRLNALPKLVASRTLGQVSWRNARLASGDIVEEVARLKAGPGGDIALFGSAGLARTLDVAGLIDEYRFLVTPVVLGEGRSAFPAPRPRQPLVLVKADRWGSGTMALTYHRAGGEAAAA